MAVAHMKKTVNVGIIGIFLITMFLLAQHVFGDIAVLSGGRSAGNSTETGRYAEMAVYPLGKVEVLNFQRMGFTKGFLRFSSDGRYLAAGTETGDLLLLTSEGKLLWRKNIGLGKISAIAFTHDNSGVLVGETSQQGALILFDARDGREIWRQSSAPELEVNIKEKTYPGMVAIKTDSFGSIYAVGLRYIRHPDGKNEYRGRIYKFSQQGEKLGVFPQDNNLDGWVNWLGVDQKGERLVFGTANWDEGRSWVYSDTMYCLDGKLEKILWSTLLPPIEPYKNSTMRNSPEISPDGSIIAGIVSDGRCFLYDAAAGTKIWQRSVSRPHKIAGVFMNATGLYVRIEGPYAVFTTGNTYNRANWQMPTPVEHPSSNSVFVFDRAGEFVSRYQTGGMIEDIDTGEKIVAVAVGRNVRSKDTTVHGLTLIALPEAGLADRLATTGPGVAAAVTADGAYAALIEAPLQLDDGQVIGEYKLHMVKRR